MNVDNPPQGIRLAFNEPIVTPGRIRGFADIPDVITMDIPPMEYLVPALGIARNTITLWTGLDGDGKTYLAQVMALAVARGQSFLGMACQQSPVLYVDLENPGYAVQGRIQPLVEEDGNSPANLRIWGTWLAIEQQPPLAGSELLLTICKETRPLLIVDPFRYFHQAEENDSTAMSGVMQYLRACAASGCAVVILHHPAKAEGSTGRGSSAIRGACDLAFLHSLDKESGLITLKVDKNRNGESRTVTIRADFEDGRFEVTEAPYITRRNDELAKVEGVIKSYPGITQNGIAKESGIRRNRLPRLLDEGCGTLWHLEQGKNRSKLFFPGTCGAVVQEPPGTTDTTRESGGGVVSVVRRTMGGTTVPPTDPQASKAEGKSLPSCPKCGGYALYKGVCQTCQPPRTDH